MRQHQDPLGSMPVFDTHNFMNARKMIGFQ